MTTATIRTIDAKPRTWEGQHGPGAAVVVYFEDGTKGEVGTKPDYAQGHIDRLTPLIGVPSEFTLEPGRFEGTWKIKDYPGKPQPQGSGGGGGGGKEWRESFQNSREGVLFHEQAINARLVYETLMAHELAGRFNEDDDLEEIFTGQLKMLNDALGEPARNAEAASPAPPFNDPGKAATTPAVPATSEGGSPIVPLDVTVCPSCGREAPAGGRMIHKPGCPEKAA